MNIMSEETKQPNTENTQAAKAAVDTNAGAAQAVAKSVYGGRAQAGGRQGGGQQGGARRGGPRRDNREKGEGDEYEQRMIDVARVTRVMAGGKRMRFRACVAVGNKKGKVAIGLAKGADVTLAVNKAATKAKNSFIEVPIVNETIPHAITTKLGAAQILFKPAKKGSGVIAGGSVRIILELAGVKNVTSKILGTNNKMNNAKCVIKALASLKAAPVKEKAEKKTEVVETVEKKAVTKPAKKEEK